jgi:hypothetical protein
MRGCDENPVRWLFMGRHLIDNADLIGLPLNEGLRDKGPIPPSRS